MLDIVQKFGFWPKSLIDLWKSKSNWLWFHAVSVGEFNAIWPLILNIHKEKSNYPIMISCTTKAGYKLAKEKAKENNFLVFYFPFDLPPVISSLLSYAKVKLLVIVETEIWPVTLSECYKRKIPIVLVNARLSDKSYKNYRLFKFYFKNIINLFTEVLAQSESDANKFLSLGLIKTKIKTLGNIKFVTYIDPKTKNGNGLIAESNNNKNIIKIIFASTHPGEEEIAINIFKELFSRFKNIRLIIAPRHVNRVSEIVELVKSNKLNPVLRSRNETVKLQDDIFILDTIGELTKYYSESQITIVGGTFAKIGGHNIIEPIRAKSYTIIGPHDFKIKELSNIFKTKQALVQVKDQKELGTKIKEAITNSELRENTIKNGLKIIEENKNVLNETIQHILAYI